ncbi:MAG: glycosyltransferase family 9 protein [Nodosilinea sp.]
MRALALVPGGVEHQLAFFPIIQQISDGFENAEISVVADPEVKEVYRLAKAVKEVVPYNFKARNSPADWANLLGIVRDREFEVVLTPSQSWSSGLLLWLTGIPTRIGYEGSANNLFLTKTVPLTPNQSVANPLAALLQGLDLTDPPPPLTINVPQSDIAAVEALGKTAGLDGGYVLFYPGHTPSGDTYPDVGWVPILKDFQQRQPELPLVLVQTPDTAAQVAVISQSVVGLKSIQPATTGELAALIAGANLLIAVDSYPLDLAAALGVYAVGLFAQGQPHRPHRPEGGEDRLVSLVSVSERIADIAPTAILKKIWTENP